MNQTQVFCEDAVLQIQTGLTPAVENVHHEFRDKQTLTFSAGNSEHPDWFIQEYAGGRRILVSIDMATGETHFLRNL
jgi:hypothetical protein